MSETQVGTVNEHRLITPGHDGWERTARPHDENKYFLVNTDSHANDPGDLYVGRIPEENLPRVPRIEVDEKGNQWLIVETWRPQLVRPASAQSVEELNQSVDPFDFGNAERWTDLLEPDDELRMDAASTKTPDSPGLERRYRDAERDGIDAEVVFANRGLLAFATRDAVFSGQMCRAWNRWAWELYGEHNDRFSPMAMIAPMDLDAAIEEVHWAAEAGFRGFNLPCRPVNGEVQARQAQYNSPIFDPLWKAIEETGKPMTFHVATGRDPRAATGPGGAIFNLPMGSISQVVEPLAYMLSSGVLERFPSLTVGTVEGGIGWLPWLLQGLDEAALKHHMWVRPMLPELPSFYYRRQCFSTFIEDPVGLRVIEELDLANNVMWSNDYPHQEGTWPHSTEAIERQMQDLSEDARSRVLGLNAARVFKFAP